MDFQLSDYQRELVAVTREFARAKFGPQAFTWEGRDAFPREYLALLAAQGLAGITIPEADGGQGATLLDAVLAIEIEQGRVRRERWGPRIIDIDILSYGEIRLTSARLTLPHPAMSERAFVLMPLREIAPDYRIGSQTIAGRLTELDTQGIEPMAVFRSPT